MQAGFLKRAIAYIIDGIIFYILIIVLMTGLRVLNFAPRDVASINLFTLLPSMIGFLVLYLFYYVYLEASPWQATLGKKILGIKVVDSNCHRISFGRSLGRNLTMGLSSMTFSIGYLMCLWTKKSQCLHDMISDCMVVTADVEPSTEYPPTPTPFIMWVCVFIVLAIWAVSVALPFVICSKTACF